MQEKVYILRSFSINRIINFLPPWYLFIPKYTIININASIPEQKKLKKFNIAVLKDNPEFQVIL